MTTVQFPPKLMREASHDWNIVGNTAVSGQTATSSVDVRSDGGGLWSASLNDIQFWDQSFTLLWRALRQICNGGVAPIVVPRNDGVFAPFPVGQQPVVIPHSDAMLFDDGSGYVQSIIDITCVITAGLRAVSMVVTFNNSAPLQGGESFSILHPTFGWRLYEIGTVTPVPNSNSATITFNPPLREAITSVPTQLEFDQPRCTMKLAKSSAMDLNVTTWPFSLATVKFVESKYAT